MAIATLALCYNNPEVFTGVVKIRKGVAVALIMESTNMDNLKAIFAQFAEEVYLILLQPFCLLVCLFVCLFVCLVLLQRVSSGTSYIY